MYRRQIIEKTDSIVEQVQASGSKKFGTIEQLQRTLGTDKYLQHFDRYRPGVDTAIATPFSGCFIFEWMVSIALSGKFNIRKNIFGLEHVGFIRPKVHTRLIPASTWATGMLLVSGSCILS
jgi:hypothetical protein